MTRADRRPRSIGRESLGRRAALAVALVALAACARVPVRPEPVLVREPRVEAIPVRIGVRFSDEFRGFLYERQEGPRGEPARGLGVPLVIGEPSVQLLHEALALLFSDVVEVSSLVGAGRAADLTGVIEPSLLAVSYTLLRTRVEITYGFSLYSRDGERIAAWSVTGLGIAPRLDDFAMFAIVNDRVRDCLGLAMRDAAWKFTSGFREQPAVRLWLARQGLS